MLGFFGVGASLSDLGVNGTLTLYLDIPRSIDARTQLLASHCSQAKRLVFCIPAVRLCCWCNLCVLLWFLFSLLWQLATLKCYLRRRYPGYSLWAVNTILLQLKRWHSFTNPISGGRSGVVGVFWRLNCVVHLQVSPCSPDSYFRIWWMLHFLESKYRQGINCKNKTTLAWFYLRVCSLKPQKLP